MKRLWLILLIVSCTTAPKMNYNGQGTPYTIPIEYQYIKNTDYYYFYDTKTEFYPNGVIKEKYTLRPGEPDGKKWGVQTGHYPDGSLKYKRFYYRHSPDDNKRYYYGVRFAETGEINESTAGGLFKNQPVDFDKLINDWKKLEIKDGEGFYDGEKIIFLDYNYEFEKAYNAQFEAEAKAKDEELPPLLETLTNIAVIEFSAKGVSSFEASALTDELEVQIVSLSKSITVIERGRMEEIVKEQGFQQSGCITSECAVQVGQLLGADNVVIGSIIKLGSTYSVTAKIVSIETGSIIRTATIKHRGAIDYLLTNSMREIAINLLSK